MKRGAPLRRYKPLQARTPLQARKGLKTNSAPTRRAAIRTASTARKTVRAQQRKDRDPGEFTSAVKLACRTRAGRGDPDAARCESCGAWLGRYLGVIQHRRARMAGGCRLHIINSIVNAALQCWPCNALAESRDRDMNGAGFWLQNNEPPDVTPILLHSVGGSGMKVWLGADGEYAYQPPRPVVA